MLNANEITINSLPKNIGQIVTLLDDNKIINLPEDPSWDKQQQSLYVESLILKLSCSNFYLVETPEHNFKVIDGAERLLAIKHFFIDKTLVLENLEFMQQFDGKTVCDLDRSQTNRIMSAPVELQVIHYTTPSEIIHNLCRRINPKKFVK